MAYEDLHGKKRADEADGYPNPVDGPAGPTHRVPTGRGGGVPILLIVLALGALLALAAFLAVMWSSSRVDEGAAAPAESRIESEVGRAIAA